MSDDRSSNINLIGGRNEELDAGKTNAAASKDENVPKKKLGGKRQENKQRVGSSVFHARQLH
jgi:hypothetical protein